MPRVLPITGEYPADWPQIADRVREESGHRCIRCLHPYRTGQHGNGEWSACDALCRHGGPFGATLNGLVVRVVLAPADAVEAQRQGLVCAERRVLTVHHLDGNKSNCVWWNLLALCQRCHLIIQGRVNPHQPYMFEHSEWFKPYVAAFYAFKYQGRQISREEAMAEMPQLLELERIA